MLSNTTVRVALIGTAASLVNFPELSELSAAQQGVQGVQGLTLLRRRSDGDRKLGQKVSASTQQANEAQANEAQNAQENAQADDARKMKLIVGKLMQIVYDHMRNEGKEGAIFFRENRFFDFREKKSRFFDFRFSFKFL